MDERYRKPSHSKSEALIAATAVLGRRPPKNTGDGGPRAEWRDNHWRVWLGEGWVDLSDELDVVGLSEDLQVSDEG